MNNIDSTEHLKPILNCETGEFEMVPEPRVERQARLRRERAARKAVAFSRKRLDEARTDALTKAWQRIYDGAELPVHYDIEIESGEFKRTERYTLIDAEFTLNVFDPRELVGSRNAVKLKRSRSDSIPADFVHHVVLK